MLGHLAGMAEWISPFQPHQVSFKCACSRGPALVKVAAPFSAESPFNAVTIPCHVTTSSFIVLLILYCIIQGYFGVPLKCRCCYLARRFTTKEGSRLLYSTNTDCDEYARRALQDLTVAVICHGVVGISETYQLTRSEIGDVTSFPFGVVSN